MYLPFFRYLKWHQQPPLKICAAVLSLSSNWGRRRDTASIWKHHLRWAHEPAKTDDHILIFDGLSMESIFEICLIHFNFLFLLQILSLNEQNYFFDSLRETSDFPKKIKRTREGKQSYWYLHVTHSSGYLWWIFGFYQGTQPTCPT